MTQDKNQCSGCAVHQGTHMPADAVHQISDPAQQDQVKHLLDELVRLAGRRDVLHAEHMGKVMPDETLAVYCRIRDERIPALKAQIAALVAAPALPAAPAAVAVPEQRVAPGQGDEAFWAWWDPYKLPEYWFVEIHKIARDAWNAALAATPPAQAQSAVPVGFALVPLRITRAMDEVLQEEGWQWEDLLAAAHAVTEEQYESIAHDRLSRDEVRALLLEHGYTVKEGQADLKPYVYEAAADLEDLVRSRLASAPQAQDVQRDVAFEAVRKKFCKLQRYSFLLDEKGNVRRVPDFCGNWVEFEAAHTLFEPASVDAAIAAQGEA